MKPTSSEMPAPAVGHDAAAEIRQVLDGACAQIAPAWPLDQSIAVNPFWKMVKEPLSAVSARLTALSGARLLMPRAYYRQAFYAEQFGEKHLCQAVAESRSKATLAELYAVLHAQEPVVPKRARVSDVVDALHGPDEGSGVGDFILHNISQLCAAFFDEAQAQLASDKSGGLYAYFRRHAMEDRSPWLTLGLREYTKIARELPETPLALAELALTLIRVPEEEREEYLLGLLHDVLGWASLCAYRRWTAQLAGGDDDALRELLAVRLAWEWILLRAGGPSVARRFQLAMNDWKQSTLKAQASQELDWLLHRALELAWHDKLRTDILGTFRAPGVRRPSVQAVFCIDVRSEVFRRALEAIDASVQTIGFAGFFGLPIEYAPLGSGAARAQLPGLLAPTMRATDEGTHPRLAFLRNRSEKLDAAFEDFRTGSLSAFSFVDACGPWYAIKLLRANYNRSASISRPNDKVKPRLASFVDGRTLTLDDKTKLALGILRAMSLTQDFARVVLLVGHGGQSQNNPHRATLDCGACCGQSGEVNARVAAALLNDPAVRSALLVHGIEVPSSTWFLPALHDTTTDDVRLFDLDELPGPHRAEVEDLQQRLVRAGALARAERAPRLGQPHLAPDRLAQAFRSRARNWSQVRPEWGLANNASFIVAPRERTRSLKLDGRCFLHEYRAEVDRDGSILELIVTAPMVVTHWINMQYYASTVDNAHYGSGNKALHNVVGRHLGVFEGNGGDLRIGLPLQCLHDGHQWMHTPLRLSVFIEAPRAAIESVLRKHEGVHALVRNQWIDLFQIDPAGEDVWHLRGQDWVASRHGP